ncbi:MAG: HPr-rel-A system PqqD family peptide chaperone [Sphingomonas sp.]|jgi:PqqD family protein of HPr-rel-A system
MAALYRAPPAAALRVEAVDAVTLIYHRASGITHVVGAPVPEILAALSVEELSGEGMSAAELLARLGRDYDLVDADADALSARLDELVAAGLVEMLEGPA